MRSADRRQRHILSQLRIVNIAGGATLQLHSTSARPSNQEQRLRDRGIYIGVFYAAHRIYPFNRRHKQSERVRRRRQRACDRGTCAEFA